MSESGVVCDADTVCMKHIDGIVMQPLRKLSTVFFESIIVIIKTVCVCVRLYVEVNADGVQSFCIFTQRVARVVCIYSAKAKSINCYFLRTPVVNINVQKLLALYRYLVFSVFKHCRNRQPMNTYGIHKRHRCARAKKRERKKYFVPME